MTRVFMTEQQRLAAAKIQAKADAIEKLRHPERYDPKTGKRKKPPPK